MFIYVVDNYDVNIENLLYKSLYKNKLQSHRHRILEGLTILAKPKYWFPQQWLLRKVEHYTNESSQPKTIFKTRCRCHNASFKRKSLGWTIQANEIIAAICSSCYIVHYHSFHSYRTAWIWNGAKQEPL